MQTAEFSSLPELQTRTHMLGELLDTFTSILVKPEALPAPSHDFNHLRNKFNATREYAKSLLVVRMQSTYQNNDAHSDSDRSILRNDVAEQLQALCGSGTCVTAIGDNEYAVLLIGYDQCSELIPRLETILASAQSGSFCAHGRGIPCHIGVVRAPLDTEELHTAVAMASTAANELTGSASAFQFMSRRHKNWVH
jgi:predicted signal transduction protein with EAL and GGDEF domain